MKKIFIFAVLASIAAVPAMAETFTRDGVTYDYTSKTVGEATIISGKVVNSGEKFRLRVKGVRVVGQVGARQVTFRTAGVATKGGSTILAAK